MMLTRRTFLRILAALAGSTATSALARAIPSSVPAPEPQAVEAAVVDPTETPTESPTATPFPTAVATSTPTLPPVGLVIARGDQFYCGGELFPIRGFNYYPRLHPWRTFNSGEWDPTATQQELELAVGLGANTVRTFIDYQASLGKYQPQQIEDRFGTPTDQYVESVHQFLDIAGKVGLRVIVTLFDGLGWQLYQPQWRWTHQEYVEALLPTFIDDPRILCWDLQNEPDRAIALVGADVVIPFFHRIAMSIRQLDPRHLQTIGWIDRAKGKYFSEFDSDLDFWCFHFYDDAAKLGDLVQSYKGMTTKPVLLEEFGLPTGGPGVGGQQLELDQAEHYRSVLATLVSSGMCGSVFWTLNDFPVGLAGNPPIQEDSPENHFGVFRLDYSEKPAVTELRNAWRPPATLRSIPM